MCECPVFYATTEGHTRRIAERISAALHARGLDSRPDQRAQRARGFMKGDRAMTPLPHRYTVDLSRGPAGYARVECDALPGIRIAPPAEYGGPGDAWTPEHLLLASVNACFLFTFRAVTVAAHVYFEYLELTSAGIVDRQDGTTRFTEIVLRPRVMIGPDTDAQKILRLMHKAERACLVSASLGTPIRVEPEIVAASCPA